MLFQTSLQLLKLGREISRPVLRAALVPVTVSPVVQVKISACDSVLVEIDAVHSSHEHKAYTPGGSEFHLERLPIWLHSGSRFLSLPIYCGVSIVAGGVAVC